MQVNDAPRATRYTRRMTMADQSRPEWLEVGRRLRWIELAEGKNGNRIAAELGIDRRMWSKYKTGKHELPIWIAGELRRLYGCALDWLYLDEEYHNAEPFKRRLAEARTRVGRQSGPARAPNKGDAPSRA
jgi:transcriptional regulator with XRE-family HTH domain